MRRELRPVCVSMVIPPESLDIRGFPYLDAQKGEQPERRAERHRACPIAAPARGDATPLGRG
jgi:hypothetical protein